MSNKHYDEASVLKSLAKNPAIKINNNGSFRCIIVDKTSPYVGIRTLGKIDFLCHYVKEHTYTAQFNNMQKVSKERDVANDNNDTHQTKRSKINMVSMVKSVTKKPNFH